MSRCLRWAADVSSLRTMDGRQKNKWAVQMEMTAIADKMEFEWKQSSLNGDKTTAKGAKPVF